MLELLFLFFLPQLFALILFFFGMLRLRNWMALNSTTEFKKGDLSLGDYVLLRGRVTCSDLSSLIVPFTGEKGIYYYCKMSEYRHETPTAGELVLSGLSGYGQRNQGHLDSKAMTDRVTFVRLLLDEGGEIDVKTTVATFLAKNKKQQSENGLLPAIMGIFNGSFSGYVKSIDLDEGVTVLGTVMEFNNKGFVGAGSFGQPMIISNYSQTELDDYRNMGIVLMVIAGIISGFSLFHIIFGGLG